MAVATGRCAYPSDLTDAQWALIEPWLSDRAWTGRPRTLDLRAVVNAVLYLLRTGCQWRYLPREFPHWCSVRYYYDLWMWNGAWERINAALSAADRQRVGRDAQPGFVVVARRWVVERALAWCSRNRRLAKEYEHLAASSTLLLYCAAAHLLLKRLAPDLTAPKPYAPACPG